MDQITWVYKYLIDIVKSDIDFFTSSGIDITYSNISGVSGVINQATKV